MVEGEKFFEEAREQSLAKATIVEKYFVTWAKIISATLLRHDAGKGGGRFGYIDLFAGPGRYKSGASSTPLRVLQVAVQDPVFCERFVSIFNDKDQASVRSLEEEIRAIPGIERLKFPPEVWNQEVGDKIAADFARINTIPLLAFIDPWGYKGLSLRLVNSFLKSWGCDCIFFFNYSRINAGLSNSCVREHMEALFGAERVPLILRQLEGMPPNDRELTIISELTAALTDGRERFVLPFRFRNASGKRTTHHLIFVTKSFKGYDVMKSVMASESSRDDSGVPSFEFNLADERFPMLAGLLSPQDDLPGLIARDFAGRRLTRADVYRSHSVGRPFLGKNYRDALLKLEADGRLLVHCGARKRKAGTLAEDLEIEFLR